MTVTPIYNNNDEQTWYLCVERAIISDLVATDRLSAIRFMARIIGEAGGLSRGEIEIAARAMLGREELGSTGLGQGVATPHTRHPCMKHFFVGWFIAREPLDFSALDDEPVWLFNCMIGPPDQPGYHLRLLEFSSRLLKSAEFVEIARKGVAHLQEFFNSLKDDARIGSALNRLAMEEARFRSAAGEADWAGCQAAFARMGTVSVEIEAELRELGLDRPVQEQLERSRTDLAGSADRAKQVWLYQAIQELAGCRLDSIAIEVNGQSVSIRATDKEHASARTSAGPSPHCPDWSVIGPRSGSREHPWRARAPMSRKGSCPRARPSGRIVPKGPAWRRQSFGLPARGSDRSRS